MASADFPTSLQESHDVASEVEHVSSSDEVYINVCSPCDCKGKRNKATMYCLDCQELLCKSCKESHQSFKQSKDHTFSLVASDRRVLLEAKVVQTSKANIRIPSDKKSPQITGCVFLPNGGVVLCDRRNDNVKLLDASYTVKESLGFPGQPRDVSVVGDKTVIICLPDHKSLQYVDVEPKLTPGRVILLKKMPLAVEVVEDEIYVPCKGPNKSGTGEILILNKDGNLKREIGKQADGSFLFDCPSDITVSKTTRNIFVSDRETSFVTCLSPSGSVLYQYKSPDLIRARGLYLDAVDNIFVCGESSTNLQVLTTTGKMHKELLTAADVVKQPCSIAYREENGMLLIGCYNQNYIYMFTLA